MSTIEIRKVTKQFGSFTAVKDADLKVEAGEVVCLLGPSGCGKTTTLRMIAGLERATSGDVIIAGQRMNELPPQKRDIAMVFQSYALYPHMSVRNNIAFGLKMANMPKEEIVRVLDTAARFRMVNERRIKKVPTLRGRTVGFVFQLAPAGHEPLPSVIQWLTTPAVPMVRVIMLPVSLKA